MKTRIVFVACGNPWSKDSCLIPIDKVAEVLSPEGDSKVDVAGTLYPCIGETFSKSLRVLNLEDDRIYWTGYTGDGV